MDADLLKWFSHSAIYVQHDASSYFSKAFNLGSMFFGCLAQRQNSHSFDALTGTEHLQKWEQYDIRIDPEREILGCIPEMAFAGPYL